jgi:diacylglycerol kinase family enzyme
MDAYYKGGIPSPSQAVWTFVRAVSSALINGPFACKMFERTDAEVTVEGKTWPYKNFSAIAAGSIPYLGLGFKVFYLAQKARTFHAFGFSLPPRNVLRYVPLMYLGRPNGCPDWIEGQATRMTVKLAEPRAYTIDGDIHPPVDTFDISLGPRLTVIVK